MNQSSNAASHLTTTLVVRQNLRLDSLRECCFVLRVEDTMGSKPAVRFCIRYDQQRMQLFTARQMKDDSLVVVLNPEDRHTLDQKIQTRIVANRFSVHPSIRSHGILLKHTRSFDDSSTTTSSQFVGNKDETLCAVLYTKVSPVMTERYKASPKSRDTVVDLGHYSKGDGCALLHSVVVFHRDASAPDIRGFSKFTRTFRQFTLAIYVCYANYVSTNLGAEAIPITSPREVDGTPIEVFDRFEGASISPQELPGALLRLCQAVSSYVLTGIGDAVPGYFAETPVFFHPTTADLWRRRHRTGEV